MDILISDYNGAYQQRAIDVKKLISTERKVYAMHTGGIVIECLLSGMVATYYGVTNRTTSSRTWIVTRNVTSKHVTDDTFKKYITVPKDHNFKQWLELLDGLKLESHIVAAFEMIQRPVNNETYINLRYSSREAIEEGVFNEWEKQYKLLIKWLVNQIQNL